MLEIVVPFGPIAQLKVSGSTPHELLSQLTAVEQSEIPLTLGRVIKKSEVQESLGRILGAEQVDVVPKRNEGQEEAREQFSDSNNVPAWAEVVPDAPIINGVPAWRVNLATDDAPRYAFVHPTDNVDDRLPKTDNPNDPRLEKGEAMFFKPLD